MTISTEDPGPEQALRSTRRAVKASVTPPLGRLRSQPPIHGRGALLEVLRQAVDGVGDRVRLVHGLSGSGKSMLALHLADYARRTHRTEVWWVKADDESTLVEHLRALGHVVADGADIFARPDPALYLWTALEGLRQRWLLVIDNADDHEVLAAGASPLADGQGWLRPYEGEFGTVLVLSRVRDAERPIGWWTAHEVGMLDERDAVAVLGDHVTIADDERDAARELVNRLGRLPLALRLAGAFLNDARRDALWGLTDQPLTIRHYLRRIDGGAEPLTSTASHFVERQWTVSLDLLRHRGHPLTLDLLRLLAQLAPAPVPLGAVLDNAVLDLVGLPGRELGGSVEDLRALALIEVLVDASGGAQVSLHPLVRDAVRRAFPPTAAAVAALATMLRSCRTVRVPGRGTPEPDFAEVWPGWIALTPHAQQLVTTLLDDLPGQPAPIVRDVCYVATYAARSMHARGLYRAADAELAKIERLAVRDLPAEDPETLRCRHNRAVVRYSAGDLDEAYAMFDAVHEARLRTLGEDDQETVRSRHYRAMVRHDQGRHEIAEIEYRTVLDKRVAILGPRHRHTLATRHNLARLLQDTGKLAQAEARYRDILADQRREFGPDYRHTLATWHNLALCLHAQGRLDEAGAEYDQIVEIECRLLGAEHPDTLATRANLAMLLAARGLRREAEQLRLEVLAEQCRALGPDHPETRATRDRQIHRFTRPGPL